MQDPVGSLQISRAIQVADGHVVLGSEFDSLVVHAVRFFPIMNFENRISILGVRSPLVVDYEETLQRLNVDLVAAITTGGPVRLLSRKHLCSFEDAKARFGDVPCLPCAFSPQRREELVRLAQAADFELCNAVIDPHAVVAASSKIGLGSYINAGVVIGGASIVDKCCVINRNASVGHHCYVSEFVSLGPGAILASNVRVGKNAMIGAGATVLPDVRIAENAVVSAGAVVRRDVAANTLVSGNPARASRLKPSKSKVWSTDQE